MAGLCGECTACCKVFEIKELDKPFQTPCKHIGRTADGPGCRIYSERPGACWRYVCLWLDSQRRTDVESMPEDLRPDRCGVLFGWPWGVERQTLHAYPIEDPDAWRFGRAAQYLRNILNLGAKVVVYVSSKEIYAINGQMAVKGSEAEFAEILNSENEDVV